LGISKALNLFGTVVFELLFGDAFPGLQDDSCVDLFTEFWSGKGMAVDSIKVLISSSA